MMTEEMIPSIKKQLCQSGFDLCHPIHTAWYNNLIRDEGLVDCGTLELLPEPHAILDDAGDDYVADCNSLLIGNTKEVWPLFLRWLASKVEEKKMEKSNLNDEEALEQITSPFDTFVNESIQRVLQHCCCKEKSVLKSYEIFWSSGKTQKVDIDTVCDSANFDGAENNNDHCYNDKENSFLVSMQRVATTTGKYWHDDGATKLCVHPEYGTWTAFRAVVVFETRDPRCSVPRSPPPCPCPAASEEIEMAKTVFDYALRMSSSDEQGYGATLNKSWTELCDYLHGSVCSGSTWEKVPDTMKPWIQLRDCISVGREDWKYSQPQLLYHYTRDHEILNSELKVLNSNSQSLRSAA